MKDNLIDMNSLNNLVEMKKNDSPKDMNKSGKSIQIYKNINKKEVENSFCHKNIDNMISQISNQKKKRNNKESIIKDIGGIATKETSTICDNVRNR